MPMEQVAATPAAKKADSKSKFRSLEAQRSDNGGFIVRVSHEQPRNSVYVEPDTLTFGPDEGGKVMAEIGKCLGIAGAGAKQPDGKK